MARTKVWYGVWFNDPKRGIRDLSHHRSLAAAYKARDKRARDAEEPWRYTVTTIRYLSFDRVEPGVTIDRPIKP